MMVLAIVILVCLAPVWGQQQLSLTSTIQPLGLNMLSIHEVSKTLLSFLRKSFFITPNTIIYPNLLKNKNKKNTVKQLKNLNLQI